MHDTPPIARRQSIADRLGRGEPVAASALAAEFGVSEDAIRRDLRALAQEGVCERVYGGALPLSPARGPVAARAARIPEAKQALARAALAHIRPGMFLFLDTGSTVAILAAMLPAGVTVLTGSIPAAAALYARPDITLILLGGTVAPEAGGATDGRALLELSRHRPDLAVLGACAAAPEGLCGFDAADVEIKRMALEVSARSLLMLTADKIGTTAPFHIAAPGDITHLVLSHDAPREALTGTRPTFAPEPA